MESVWKVFGRCWNGVGKEMGWYVKKHKKCNMETTKVKKVSKNLHMSKKKSNFVRFLGKLKTEN